MEEKRYHIKLDIFEGPLDLLWNLISRSKLDIVQISLAKITEEFIKHIEMMKFLDIEVASDFILMASTLLHFKSKSLLPKEIDLSEENIISLPPELVQQLLEYKKFQQAAEKLEDLEKNTENIFIRKNDQICFDFPEDNNWQEISLLDLLSVFSQIANNFEPTSINEIQINEISVEECMIKIRNKNQQDINFLFSDLFTAKPSRIEIVTVFLAVLEMVRLKEISVRQHQLFGDIRIFRVNSEVVPA